MGKITQKCSKQKWVKGAAEARSQRRGGGQSSSRGHRRASGAARHRSRWRGGASTRAWSLSAPRPLAPLGASRQRFPTATANLYPYPCRLSSLGSPSPRFPPAPLLPSLLLSASRFPLHVSRLGSRLSTRISAVPVQLGTPLSRRSVGVRGGFGSLTSKARPPFRTAGAMSASNLTLIV